MSVVEYLSGNVRCERREELVDLEAGVRERRAEGEELVGGLRRAGDLGEFYDCVEDYDPILRWHCRL